MVPEERVPVPRRCGLLRNLGPLTATQAAEHVGESPSNCSFHLRQLARWGLVEQAGGGKGRERPWQASAQFTNWQQSPVKGEGADARIALDRVLVQEYLDQIGEWFDRRSSEDDEWLGVSGLGDWSLHLTADELRALGEKIDALVEPYVQRSARPENRPAGSRRVTFIHALLPDRKAEPSNGQVE
jgi:hypothetical protein